MWDSMKKVLVLAFILTFSFVNFKSINAEEPKGYFNLPKIYNQFLDTSIKENSYLYPVNVNGLYGFIDVNGKIVVKPQFNDYENLNYSSSSHENYLAYTYDKSYIPDENNYNSLINGTYLIMPKSKVIKLSDNQVEPNFSENKNYALFNDKAYENGKSVGYSIIYDLKNEKIIKKKVGFFEIVGVYDNFYISNIQNKCYMFDYNNKIISEGYDEFLMSKDKTYFFKNKDTVFWLNEKGKAFFQYDRCVEYNPFYNGIAPISDDRRNLKFINENKDVLNYYSFDNNYRLIKKDNFYIVTSLDKQIILDLNGNKKLPDDYGNTLYSLNDYYPATAYNKNSHKFDVFDKNGIIKASYKIPEGFVNPALIGDCIQLQNDEGYGLCKINSNNVDWILEPKYSYIQYFDPYVVVSVDNFMNQGVFDLKTKKFILETKYTYITVYDKNMIYVRTPYFTGYANSKGEFVYALSNYNLGNDN